jgi:hypothetical protein
MARPERRDVDYFPFIVKRGRTLNILQSKYGLEGIGFFTNLMRLLSSTPDHYYCIKGEFERVNFFTEIGMQDENKGIEMIELMVRTEKLDKDLWENHKVIACEAFLKSLEDAYKRRSNQIITLEEIRGKFLNPVIVYGNSENSNTSGVIVSKNDTETTLMSEETPVSDDIYPQRIVKDRIVKDRIVKDRIVNSEVISSTENPQNIDFPETLPEYFIRRWQQTPDVFNCLARLKKPNDWDAFWEQNAMTMKQIDLALNNYIEGLRTGAIERKYIPSSPDGFVLNGHLARSIEPYKKPNQRIANDSIPVDEASKYFSRTRRGLKK